MEATPQIEEKKAEVPAAASSPENPDAVVSSKKAQKKQAYIQNNLSQADIKLAEDLGLSNLAPAELKALVKAGKICFKCKQRAPNYCNKQDKVCKPCFMDSIVHRFKQSLRLNLKIWKDDLNLICVSGGSNSMALLELMYDSLFGTNTMSQRKMFFSVHVLYIDEGPAVYGWTPEFHAEQLELIASACTSYKFSYTILPLEHVFDIDEQLLNFKQPTLAEKKALEEEKKNDFDNHTTQSEAILEVQDKIVEVPHREQKTGDLKKLIECLPAESSFREDMVFFLKKLVISEFALKYNFKKILFGTTSHKVATHLFSQLCKGRGASVAHEIAFVDDKHFGGRISFMNPMRDFLKKEITLYNHNKEVKIIQVQPLAKQTQESLSRPTNAPCYGSTDLLVESFFNRLQDRYNVNTVPTVVRLTNKLEKTIDDLEEIPPLEHPVHNPEEQKVVEKDPRAFPFCPLCMGIRDRIHNLLEIGSTISKINVQEGKPDEPVSVSTVNEWFEDKREQVLCFGCKRMAISAGKNRMALLDQLPKVVLANCQRTIDSEGL